MTQAATLLPERAQIKSRDRVRELAEVYTHRREVDAMLDLVPDTFPSEADPGRVDRKFLEPACGSGNFLVEILARKLLYASADHEVLPGVGYEELVLRALASVYAVDIDRENVEESRGRLREVVAARLAHDGVLATPGLESAVDAVLATNVLRADTLTEATTLLLVDYRPVGDGRFLREWSPLDEGDASEDDLFGALVTKRRADAVAVHYSELAANPRPTRRPSTRRTSS